MTSHDYFCRFLFAELQVLYLPLVLGTVVAMWVLGFFTKKTCSTMFGAPVHCTLGHLRLMDEIVNCLRSYCRVKGLLNAIICLFLRNYEPKMENSLLGPTRRCCTVTSVVGVVQSISYFDSARYIRFSK